MAIEQNNNFELKKAEHIDAKLKKVANSAALPNPNLATNFIYEGAIIYVIDEKDNYQAQEDPENAPDLHWVNIGIPVGVGEQPNIGTITVVAGSGDLNMSTVVPAIATCHTVNVVVTGGDSYTVNSISNMPLGQETKFTTDAGNSVTFSHTDYDSAGAGDITMEIGFNFQLVGRSVANESLTLINENSVLTQVTAEQFVNASELCNLLAGLGVTVVDNLNSSSTTQALSANQGNVLLGLLEEKQDAFNISGLLAWNEDQSTLTGKYPQVQYTISPPNISNGVSYLTTQLPNYISHHIVKLRGDTSLAGVWLLPGGDTSTDDFDNWIQLSSNFEQPYGWCSFTIAPEATVNATNAESNGRYAMKMQESALSPYGTHGVTFNPANGSDEKVNIALQGGFTYDVQITVECETDQWENFYLLPRRHSAFGDITNAIPGFSISVDVWPASFPAAASQSKGTYTLSFRVEVESGSSNNKITFAWEPRLGVVSPNAITRIVSGGYVVVKKVPANN